MITRRDLLRGVAGTAGLLGWPPGHASGEPPPETTRLRLFKFPSLCVAPQYVAEDLLRGEGFTDVKYVESADGRRASQRLGHGRDRLHAAAFVRSFVQRDRRGTPSSSWRASTWAASSCSATRADPRGPGSQGEDRRGVGRGKSPGSVFVATMAAHVGLDPQKDIAWVDASRRRVGQLLADGEGRCVHGVPADPQELRARKDRPRRA